MNRNDNKSHQYKGKRKRMAIYATMYPLGGYVAWPEANSLAQSVDANKEAVKPLNRRSGFVAWPEQKQCA